MFCTPRGQLHGERLGVDQEPLRQLRGVRRDLAAVGGDRLLDAQSPEDPGHGEKQGALGRVHADADPAPGPECEMVPLGHVGVGGRLGGDLVVAQIARGIEDAGVGVALGVSMDAPGSRILSDGPSNSIWHLSPGYITHHTFVIMEAFFGIL